MKYVTAGTFALVLLGTGALAQQSGVAGDQGTGVQPMEGDTQAPETGLQPVDPGGMSGDRMEATGDMPGTGMKRPEDAVIRTSDISGGAVYTVMEPSDEGWDPTNYYDRIDSGWNRVGEIEDLVLSQDGQLTGLVVEIGGFLDLGDKHVLIRLDDVNLFATNDRQYGYVTRHTEEELRNMESIDEGFWD